MDTNRAAADLGAIQHHIIGARQTGTGIALQRLLLFNLGGGKGMMQCIPALAALVVFKHRKIDDPQRPPLPLQQITIGAQLVTQRTERFVDNLLLVGAKKDQISIFGSSALHDAVDGFIRQKLENRRLQAITSVRCVIDLDISQPPCPIDADKLGITVNILA